MPLLPLDIITLCTNHCSHHVLTHMAEPACRQKKSNESKITHAKYTLLYKITTFVYPYLWTFTLLRCLIYRCSDRTSFLDSTLCQNVVFSLVSVGFSALNCPQLPFVSWFVSPVYLTPLCSLSFVSSASLSC